MAKNNISISEFPKNTRTKEKSLMEDMDEMPATQKAISVSYLAFRTAARKAIADKFPTTNNARIGLRLIEKQQT